MRARFLLFILTLGLLNSTGCSAIFNNVDDLAALTGELNSVVNSSQLGLTINGEAVAAVDFSEQSLSTETDRTIKIANSAETKIEITEIALSDGDHFTIATDSCTGTLDIGASCEVKLNFKPVTVGEFSDQISISFYGANSEEKEILTLSKDVNGVGLGIKSVSIAVKTGHLAKIMDDGADTTVLTATIVDKKSNPVTKSGVAVHLNIPTDGGTAAVDADTNASGVVEFTLTSSTTAGTYNYTADADGKTSDPVQVEFAYCASTRLSPGLSPPFADGDGSMGDSYRICTAAQLNAIGDNAGYMNDWFIVSQDIDMTDLGATPFNMIGSAANPFTGNFNGTFKTISNLTINGGANDDIGLFRRTDTGASIVQLNVEVDSITTTGDNVGVIVGYANRSTGVTLVNIDGSGTGTITGGSSVGGVIGHGGNDFANPSSIQLVHVTGLTVNAASTAGGLLGQRRSNVTRSSTSSTVSVNCTGGDQCGGAVGYSNELIEMVYSGATVTGIGDYVGGISGYKGDDNITDSYFNGALSGNDYVGGIVGQSDGGSTLRNYTNVTSFSAVGVNKGCIYHSTSNGNFYVNTCTHGGGGHSVTLAAIQDQTLLMNFGWDFSTRWAMPSAGGAPVLRWQESPTNPTVASLFAGGNGTPGTPWLIGTAQQLKNMAYAHQLDGTTRDDHFELTANIDLSGETVHPMFSPEEFAFDGDFDGGGFQIQNLSLNYAGVNYIGLFRRMSGGNIHDLTVTVSSISGGQNVGAILGRSDGATQLTTLDVRGVGAGGTVLGDYYAGGIVGYCGPTGGNCIVGPANIGVSGGTLSVTATNDYAGGLSAYGYLQTTQTIVGSNVTVTGDGYTAGLIGRAFRAIDESASKANVNGSGSYVAGITGWQENGATITNCYTSGTIQFQGGTWDYIGGVVGRGFAGSIVDSYSVADVIGTTATNDGCFNGAGPGTITDSFWDNDAAVCDVNLGVGGTGQTTANLRTLATFTTATWDIADDGVHAGEVWKIDDGNAYPRLGFEP